MDLWWGTVVEWSEQLKIHQNPASQQCRGIYASVCVHSCYLWMFLQILLLSNASSEQEGVYLLKLKLMYHKRLHSPDQDTIWFHHLNMCHEFYTKLQVVAALYHLPWLGGHHVSRKSLDAVGMPAQRERTGRLLRFILVTIMLSLLFCVSRAHWV